MPPKATSDLCGGITYVRGKRGTKARTARRHQERAFMAVRLSVLDAQAEAIARDLSRMLRGHVRFGQHDRMLYSTDASIYQVPPIGVVIPADDADVLALVRY